jgi:hypothetical protein
LKSSNYSEAARPHFSAKTLHFLSSALAGVKSSGAFHLDVLQLRLSKQDKADLFYLKAFIYGPFSDVAPAAIG